MAEAIVINERIAIDRGELEFAFSRSPGPGGQNVNKLNTKATLRWAFWSSASLPWDVKQRVHHLYAKRITEAGELLITSSRYRTQRQNIDDCIARLRSMVAAAAVPPVERRATRPTRASTVRRRDDKRAQAAKKQARRQPFRDSDE